MNVLLEQTVLDAVRKDARANDRPFSQHVNRVLREYAQNHGLLAEEKNRGTGARSRRGASVWPLNPGRPPKGPPIPSGRKELPSEPGGILPASTSTDNGGGSRLEPARL